MALVTEHLVGRAAELGSLDGAVDGPERGGPAATLLVGRAGDRQDAPARRAGRARRRARALVLTGSASELEADLPFWVFVDALDEFVAGLEPRRLGSLDDEVRAELELRAPFAAAPGRRIRGRRCRTSATAPTGPCASCSSASPRRSPLVLVLDDVHWADPASIDLLAALLRTPPVGAGAAGAGGAAEAAARAPRRRARARASRRPADSRRARCAAARGGGRAARRRRRRRRSRTPSTA